MKALIDFIEAITALSDTQRAHIEYLIKHQSVDKEQIQYGKGFKDGLKQGRELESAMWRGFAPDDLKDLIKGKHDTND